MAASEISLKKSARQYHCSPAGIQGVERALQHAERHLHEADQQRRAERLHRLEHLRGPVMWPGVAPDDAAGLAAPEFLGERRGRRDGQQADPAAQLFRQRRQQLAVPAHHLGSIRDVVQHGPADDHAVLADVVAAERERGDDAEVAAAAAQGPEQVTVGVLAGGHERAVGQDDVGGEEVVHGEAEAAGQVADAAAEGQAGHAGGGQEPGRGGHAERDGRVVDISPGAAGVNADGVILRADRGASQPGEVDDQGVVGHPQAGRVMPAAPHGDLRSVLAGEPHAGDDVGGVAAADDGGRVLVDHAVVDGARLVVSGVSRLDQFAAHGGGQVGVRRRGGARGCGGHAISPLRYVTGLVTHRTLGWPAFAERSRAAAAVRRWAERCPPGG